MSTRDIIYDQRFLRGTFKGYAVAVPHESLLNIYTTTLVEWGDHSNDVLAEVKRWLVGKGQWRQSYGTFYFSRDSTAAMFKLQYF